LLPTPNTMDGMTARSDEALARAQQSGGCSNLKDHPMFRTPTAQLAINGGSQHPDKRKAGGHGPTLADEVEHLLPTPRATDGTKGGPNQRGSSGDLMLPSAVTLLPSPTSQAAKHSTDDRGERDDANLWAVSLRIGAPTNPRSADGSECSDDPHPSPPCSPHEEADSSVPF
jgi:hypothetical protein